MKNKNITYEWLEKALLRLGFAVQRGRDRIVFRHSNTDIPVILPRMRRAAVLKPIDLLSVQNAMANGGVVPKDKFDSLLQFESDPKPRHKTTADQKSTKAQQIRVVAKAMGKSFRHKDIIAVLAEQGTTVSSAQVSTTLKAAGFHRKRRSQKPSTSTGTHRLNLEALAAAKALIQKIGNIEAAEEALAALKRLQ